MTLLDRLKEWYADGETSPPMWDSEFHLLDVEWLDDLRWGTRKRWIFRDGEEFVAVEDVEPATEMQDWGDYGEPEIYEVEPYPVVQVKYRRPTS